MLNETVIFQTLLILKSLRNAEINYADKMSYFEAKTALDNCHYPTNG
jgi:hypothetical protein